MDFQQFLTILDKNVNQEQLMKDLCKEMLFPFLEKKAKETQTTLDDALLEGLKKLVE